jgi:hypothetical protein
MSERAKCELCGEPMPAGEEMFKFHGYSGNCPKPPLPRPAAKTRAAIAIDDWKLPIFERHLSQAGYAYARSVGVTPDTLFLYVETEQLEPLAIVVKAANDEAASTGKP